MNSSRALTGLLRRGFSQSGGFKVSVNPLVYRRCHSMEKIIQSPHEWQWSSRGKMPVISHPQSSFLSQKLSFFSSVTSPHISHKEPNSDSLVEGSVADKGDEAVEPVSRNRGQAEAKETQQVTNSESGEKAAPRKLRPEPKASIVEDSDSETESDSREEKELSTEDLIKLVLEKEELLKSKHSEIQLMQDKVLRSYAEVENLMDRTKRDAENAKKFAIQNFARSLLDVADNLGRASSVVKESFSKLATTDSNGAPALLKTLLEGVDMTEKQLLDVFKKYGVEKFDPVNEHFDPHRHMAVFEVQDPNKPAGTVGVVLKAGYMLNDRVIRPAEVGVVKAVDGEAAGGSEPVDS